MKFIGTQIIARGKEAEYKAGREKWDKAFKNLGFEPPKYYWVIGRKARMVLYESPEFTQQEWEEFQKKYNASEELQKLEREVAEKGIIVEGSQEIFLLQDLE